MNFIEGMDLKGRAVEISECSRNGLPLFIKERGGITGAEVGVYKGEFSERFCKVGLKHIAIDPWMAFPGQGRTQQVQERQDFLYEHTKRVLTPYPHCTIIRATSMDAAKEFADESLDYVYIDGDHSFRYVAEDIVEWSKKVKKGGIVSGHDYWNTRPGASNVVCHVKSVIDAYTDAFGIENWYIFGKMYPLEKQTKDDQQFSWLWIKE